MLTRTARIVFALMLLLLAARVPRARGDEAQDQYRVAAGHYARGQWALAAEAFDELRRRFPNHPQVPQSRFYLAEALLQDGQTEAALAQFDAYLQHTPEGCHAHVARFRVGEATYLAGRHEAARELLGKFAQTYPNDSRVADALFYLGEISLASGDGGAAEHFREALRRYPDGRRKDGCRLRLAQSLEKQGETQAALELYQELAAQRDGPLSAEARFRLGTLQYARGDFDGALVTLKLLEGWPEAESWRARGALIGGLAQRRLGRLEEAAATFTGLCSDPTISVEAQYWLAAVRKDQKRWDDAAKILLEAAENHPRHEWIWAIRFHAGHALLMAGREDEAAQQFDLVLARKQPDCPWLDDAAMGKIQVAVRRKNAESLDRQAPAFLERFPKSPLAADVRRVWARSLLARRQYAQGAELLEAYLAAVPADRAVPQARAQLAVALARLKRWDAADAQREALLADLMAGPLAANTVESMAEAAYAAEHWPRAAEWFAWVVDHGADKSRIDRGLSGLGWTQLRAGQLAEAAETFARLLARQPETPLATRAAWARGHALEQLGRLDAAEQTYGAVVGESAESHAAPEVLLAAARLCGRRREYDRASELYGRLAKEHPGHAELDTILYEWSWVLFDGKRPDEAVSVLERLHKEFPKTRFGADATYRLAERAARAGDGPAARRLLDDVLAAECSAEVEQHALALACQVEASAQRWGEARAAAARLIEKHAEGSLRRIAEFWVAESLYRQGDYEAADAAFAELLPKVEACREPWLALVPLRRAQLLARRKQWSEAHELASTIERDYPDFESQHEVDYLLGRCLAARAEFDEARSAYERVIRSGQGAKTETAAMAQWMIGETYFHQKHYEEAIRAYLRVEILYDYPRWQAAALLQAGKCHEPLGRPAEAAKLYERLVREYPVSPFLEEAQGRLLSVGRRNDARATHPGTAGATVRQ